MAARSDYLVGSIDSSIHDFLEEIQRPPTGMTYSLITALDSCFDLPLLLEKSAPLRRLKKHTRLVGSGLLIRTSRLLAAERRERIFFGFDEVFFFQDRPRKSKPDTFSLVGPAELPSAVPPAVVKWMARYRCSLALGDGTGLNFAARLSGVARYLMTHRLEHVS